MSIRTDIKNVKLFNQLKNGENFSLNTGDFCNNNVGNVGERLKMQFDIVVQWNANASFVDLWQLENNGGVGGTITRNGGSFIEDGFFVLGQFEFYSLWTQRQSSAADFTAQIDFISLDGTELQFSLLSGTIPANETDNTMFGIWADPSINANEFLGFVYGFGLVNEDESGNINSKVSGNAQQYFNNNLQNTGATETLTAKGNFKDWQSGQVTIKRTALGTPKNTITYQLNHEFEVLPDFLQGELANLQNGQVFDLLANEKTLDYYLTVDFRHVLTTVTSAKTGQARIDSSIGWFNENFNGLPAKYSISSINVSTLNLENVNNVSVRITKLNGNIAAGVVAGVYFSYLPEEYSEYTDKTTTIQENFLKDSAIVTEGAGAVASQYISGLTATLDSGDVVLNFEIAFDANAQSVLSNGSDFRLSVQIEDQTKTAPNSDRVHLLALVGQIGYDQSNDNTQLINFTKFNVLTHSQELGVDVGAETAELWNEDGVLIDFEFELDLTKQAVLNELVFKLVSADNANEFQLDSFPIDLTNSVTNANGQQINIETTRQYILNSGDQFNIVQLDFVSSNGSIATYVGSFAQKVRWQDWRQNLNVDAVFYDVNEPQNNLNFQASNYSMVNSYDIYIQAEANIEGLDSLNKPVSTTAKQRTGVLNVRNYTESDDGQIISAVIQTVDPSNNTDLEGQFLTNGETLVRTTWQTANNLNTSDIRYVIHRIQETNSPTDNIEESSSLRGALVGGILKETNFIVSGTEVISESLIDFTKIVKERCYNLSARLQALSPVTLGYAGQFCETFPQIFTPPPKTEAPDPPEKTPAFCGVTLSASGAGGCYDFAFEVQNDGLVIAALLDPFTITDKGELFKFDSYGFAPPVILGTTHMVNVDPSLDGAINSGIGVLGGNLNPLPFNQVAGQPYTSRVLSEDAESANDPLAEQYVGAFKGSFPNRLDEYKTFTGRSTVPELDGVDLRAKQLVFAEFNTGDTAVLRISGATPTQWNVPIVFCYIRQ